MNPLEKHTGKWNNAGGYGFWCNKECAARKDAEKAEQLKKQLTQQEILKGITSGKSSTENIYLLAGLGLVFFASVTGLIIYVKNKQTN